MKSAFIITILVERFIKEELFVVGVGTQKCVLQNGCWYVQGCCTGTHCTTVPAVHRDCADTATSVRLGSLRRPQQPTLH